MMKLSEAIRLGAMLKPQGFGIYSKRLGTACALDAASLAVSHGDEWMASRSLDSFHNADVPLCPVCGNYASGKLLGTIVHFNDTHRWTRERIADWVATIEAQQEAQAPQAPQQEAVSV